MASIRLSAGSPARESASLRLAVRFMAIPRYRVAVTISPPPQEPAAVQAVRLTKAAPYLRSSLARGRVLLTWTGLQSGKLARTRPGSTFPLVPRTEVIETGLNHLYLQIVA